jgi:hypothetical protein
MKQDVLEAIRRLDDKCWTTRIAQAKRGQLKKTFDQQPVGLPAVGLPDDRGGAGIDQNIERPSCLNRFDVHPIWPI